MIEFLTLLIITFSVYAATHAGLAWAIRRTRRSD